MVFGKEQLKPFVKDLLNILFKLLVGTNIDCSVEISNFAVFFLLDFSKREREKGGEMKYVPLHACVVASVTYLFMLSHLRIQRRARKTITS